MATDAPDSMASSGAWQRTKDDASAVYSSPTFAVAMALVGVVAGAAAAEFWVAPNAQWAVPVLAGAGAILVCVVVVFIVQLVAAPYRQRNDAREEARRYSAELDAAGPLDAERDAKQLRISAAQVADELERMESLFAPGADRRWFQDHTLNSAHWFNYGQSIASASQQAHKVIRRAYRLADEAQETKTIRHDGTVEIDEQKAAEALAAVHAAIAALEPLANPT